MSTDTVLHIVQSPGVGAEPVEEAPAPTIAQADACCAWDQFAEEQVCHLVRRVFCPGWPRPARQVVISAVDQETDITGLCLQVAQTLARQIHASVCLVEHSVGPRAVKSFGRSTSDPVCGQVGRGSLRESSRQISDNLWQLPLQASAGEDGAGLSASWLLGRLAQLRHDFEYAVLHAPPTLLSSEAVLLGSLSDGVILVLEANSTRRMAARKAKELLQAANACLLGIILSERTFPIPERIYRKL
jgi:hypothetical protein